MSAKASTYRAASRRIVDWHGRFRAVPPSDEEKPETRSVAFKKGWLPMV